MYNVFMYVSTQQIADYITHSRDMAIDEATVRQVLLNAGYSVKNIEKAFELISKRDNPPGASSKFFKIFGTIFMALFVLFLAIIGGYFVIVNYFPQYVKYVSPYIEPAFEPLAVKIGLPGLFKIKSIPTDIAQPLKDSDNDGLPDVEELRYGTDPNNKDTDGDGFLDGEEVQNGYNPLGPGRLNPNSYIKSPSPSPSSLPGLPH